MFSIAYVTILIFALTSGPHTLRYFHGRCIAEAPTVVTLEGSLSEVSAKRPTGEDYAMMVLTLTDSIVVCGDSVDAPLGGILHLQVVGHRAAAERYMNGKVRLTGSVIRERRPPIYMPVAFIVSSVAPPN